MQHFDYLQPRDLAAAAELLAVGREKSLPMAGGTDLLGLLKDGVVAPEALVNLKAVPGLRSIEFAGGSGLSIGALVTVADLAEDALVREKAAVLAEAAAEAASPQLRNVGTVGGNLCQRPRCWYFRGDFHCLKKRGDRCFAFDGENRYHCIVGGGPCYIVHPSDLAVALLSLDARVQVFSGGSVVERPIGEFYVLPERDLYRETSLAPGEIVTGVRIPELPPGARSGYVKFKERAAWDFAVVSVAAVVKKAGGTIESGRLAFGGVAPVPWRDESLDKKLAGRPADEAGLAPVAAEAFRRAEPLEMNAYKVPLVRNLMKRLVARLAAGG